ncbi:MAG: hypothetical protein ACI9Y7_002354 [Dokdonia sp.]|jgi:hypothetical protein
MKKEEKHKLIVIGNGLDLSHLLKTSYLHFIKHVIFTHNEKRTVYNDLISVSGEYYFDDFDDFKYRYIDLEKKEKLRFENQFFRDLIIELSDNNYNWVDIETFYFKKLLEYRESLKMTNKLNQDFENLKKHLENYLYEITEKNDFTYNPLLINLFIKGGPSHIYFLNFNYTNTLDLYINTLEKIEKKNCSVNHIHGKIKESSNSPIFGYGNENEHYKSLLSLDEEYIRFIKSQEYSLTNNYKNLISYLDNNQNIDVCFIGHSCGESDRTILNLIVEHENIKSIEISYYPDSSNFRKTHANLTKAFSTDKFKTKTKSFPDSNIIPQTE